MKCLSKYIFGFIIVLQIAPAFAKSCTVYYESNSGTGSSIYFADNEFQAQAMFVKDFPNKRILNIVCK